MIPKPLNAFMARLFQATSDGEISWKEGGDGAYFAVQKNANLHIKASFDHDSEQSAYIFRIARGKEDAFFSVVDHEDDFSFMRNLYNSVSVNAAGGEKIVEGLFD